LTGYTTDAERLGHTVVDLVHPADQAPVEQHIAALLDQPRTPMGLEYRVRHKNGTWRHFEAVFNNLLDEPSVGAVVCNFRDITERKQAEAALQQAEAQDRTLIEQIPAINLHRRPG
jgi:PAS domain S-box-containing protein